MDAYRELLLDIRDNCEDCMFEYTASSNESVIIWSGTKTVPNEKKYRKRIAYIVLWKLNEDELIKIYA